ncbi:MAG: hypothetical protein AAF266_03880 [Planctomycetota bacterium]
MAEPWFENPNTFGAYFGTIFGVFAGLLGTALGCSAYLIQRGQGKRWIVGGLIASIALGVVLLAIGLVALVVGQPYGIWYPMLLGGGIMAGVFAFQLPMILARYRAAEERKIDSEGLRGT